MPALDDAAEFRAVAIRLKLAGEVELRKAMYRNIRLATLPARAAVRASAMETLPKSGGLNAWVAKATTRTTILTGARTAGVAIRVTKRGHDMKDVDAGVVRHPVFARSGRPRTWVSQSVPSGFASRPLTALSPAVGAACMVAMRETAAAAGFH
jgi:hypothetical protein